MGWRHAAAAATARRGTARKRMRDSGRTSSPTILALGTLILAAPAGCTGDHKAPAAVSNSPVVARVEGTRIHASDVAAQMRRTGSDRRRALDDLVTFELLAHAAAAEIAGAQVDPAEGETVRSLRVQRLVESELEPHLTAASIPQADVRNLYDRAKTRFVHGRLVEIAVLCVFTGARMKPEPRARAEETARQLHTFLTSPGRPRPTRADLEALARDPAWMNRKVNFTTAWQGEEQPFPAVVGHATQKLSRPGDLTDLVGDETGYYLALYLSELGPQAVSFAEAEPILRGEMYEPWRRQKFLQMALELARSHDIEVFPENFPLLATVEDGRGPPLPP